MLSVTASHKNVSLHLLTTVEIVVSGVSVSFEDAPRKHCYVVHQPTGSLNCAHVSSGICSILSNTKRYCLVINEISR